MDKKWKWSTLIVFLGTFDALATLYGISRGYVRESNPLMAHLIAWGWFPFAAVKGGLTGLALPFILRRRWAIWVTVAAYALLDLWHVALHLAWRGGL